MFLIVKAVLAKPTGNF